MRILLIGATGFTGGYLFDSLHEKGYEITCFARPSSNVNRIEGRAAKILYGDLSDYESLLAAFKGQDTVIFLSGLTKGFASNVVNSCKANGVSRFIFCGSTGIFTQLKPAIKEVKLEAEAIIKNSGLEYTIIRPTMIYGTSKDRNMCKLVRFVKRSSVVPVLGSGEYMQQPVYVKDLAESFVLALENPASINQEYNIAGAEPLTYNEVVSTTAKVLRKRAIKIHIPLRVCTFLLGVYEKVSKRPKFSKEQALRLNEHKDFSIEKARRELGYSPLTFGEGITREIQEMGLAK